MRNRKDRHRDGVRSRERKAERERVGLARVIGSLCDTPDLHTETKTVSVKPGKLLTT